MHSSRDIPEHDVTLLLQRMRGGDAHAASELIPLIYRELHVIAARHMRRERPNHTLQSTVLVHEAFLQLAGTDKVEWQSRAHFFRLGIAGDAASTDRPCEGGKRREAPRRPPARGA